MFGQVCRNFRAGFRTAFRTYHRRALEAIHYLQIAKSTGEIHAGFVLRLFLSDMHVVAEADRRALALVLVVVLVLVLVLARDSIFENR